MEAKTIRRVIARQLLDSAPDRLGGRPEHDRYEWRNYTANTSNPPQSGSQNVCAHACLRPSGDIHYPSSSGNHRSEVQRVEDV